MISCCFCALSRDVFWDFQPSSLLERVNDTTKESENGCHIKLERELSENYVEYKFHPNALELASNSFKTESSILTK